MTPQPEDDIRDHFRIEALRIRLNARLARLDDLERPIAERLATLVDAGSRRTFAVHGEAVTVVHGYDHPPAIIRGSLEPIATVRYAIDGAADGDVLPWPDETELRLITAEPKGFKLAGSPGA
ncbi:hypothetical protein [Singulisphaera sp. PoT]|uniref:hypothetical protein n=1 Tax=Singulisphaera sp. PoT TaxID=3411797 RepID=UPI003BF47841